MAGDKLSPAQALFVKEYFKDLNATRAYRAAYPNSSPGAANTDGPRLTKHPKIAERIDFEMKLRAARLNVEAALREFAG